MLYGAGMIVLVPDANILLQAKKPAVLPWGEIEPEEVRLFIVGPTIREIDKFKVKPGRLGRRAREVSAEIRETLGLPERTKQLRDSAPRVSMMIVPGIGVAKPLHPSLDLSHPDHALVNQCLSLLQAGTPARLLTDDTLASLVAEEAGVEALLAPQHWMLDPESDETERKLKRVETELEELRRREPRPTIEFRAVHGGRIEGLEGKLRRYPALTPSRIAELVDLAQAICPLASSFGPETLEAMVAEKRGNSADPLRSAGVLTEAASLEILRRVFRPASAKEIAAYRDDAYPDWLRKIRAKLESLHVGLNDASALPEFDLALNNVGSRPADGVVVEVAARGDLLVGRPSKASEGRSGPRSLPEPPKPPVGGISLLPHADNALLKLQAAFPDLALKSRVLPTARSLAAPDPTRFSWSPARGNASSMVEGHCMVWRHQVDEQRTTLFVESRSDGGLVRGAVEVRIGANNLARPIGATLPVKLIIVEADTSGLAETLIRDLGRGSGQGGRADRTSPRTR